MIDLAPELRLSPIAKEAIRAADERLERAFGARDLEATIGAAKDLVETVAKVVLDTAGAVYGSNASVEGLASEALAALGLSAAIQGHPSLRGLSSSLVRVVQSVAELRNSDGTGHGRATRSSLDWSHAELSRNAAISWCQWILATADRVLADRAGLDVALADIGGARAFGRGKLASYLAKLGIPSLNEADQRRLGLAVARRWTMNDTFMPLIDVVAPISDVEADYPDGFYEGLIEGLLLDRDGFILTTGADTERALEISWRLPEARRKTLFAGLANRIDEARASHALDGTSLAEATTQLASAIVDRRNAAIRAELKQIATRLTAIEPTAQAR